MSFASQFRNMQYLNIRRNILNTSFITKLSNFQIQERQFAARKGKRVALLAAKREQKLAKLAKQKSTPFQVRAKVVKGEQKKRYTDENWYETQPLDNVWRTALYRGKPYNFDEIIEMCRETHHPSILNKPDAFVYATVELDTRLKKKDRYMDSFNGVITFPYEFESRFKNRVIAVCRDEDLQMKASEVGAVYAGSSTLIKKILSGEILTEDFDYIVCHPDCLKELNVLRGILKRNYPSAHNGLLRLDVDTAVVSFTKGIRYVSEHSTVESDFAWVDVCFGRLNMDMNCLETNFNHLLTVIMKYKPLHVNFPFITKTTLWCENSIERFKVLHERHLPGYEEPATITGELVSEEAKDENVAVTKA